MLRRWLAALLPVLLALDAAQAQEIAEHSWGFDGRVVEGRFNLLRVSVHNPTDRPIDKHLELTKWSVAPRGAPIVQRCYLAPRGSRTISFYPFVTNRSLPWKLSWVEGGAAELTLSTPGLGLEATVMLEKDSAAKRLKIRSFPPAQLPASVIGMAGLRAVVMDEAPGLSMLQRRALLDWLRAGRVIHLIKRSGRHPRFEGELQFLNTPEDEFRFGSGRIVRHDYERADLGPNFPKELLDGFPKAPASTWLTPIVDQVRTEMRARIKTDHNWALLFALTIVYLFLIGPLFYKLSAERLRWPLGMAALSGVIALATWLFTIIGARGYGEQATTSSWAFARVAGEARYEVTRYADVFVTSGGDYRFDGTGDFDLFSSAQSRERVNGKIHNGKDGYYVVDIPEYSNRFVVQKSTVSGPPHGLTVARDGSITTRLDFDRVIGVSDHTFFEWHPNGRGRWLRGRHRVLWDWLASAAAGDTADVTLERVMVERLRLQDRNKKGPVTADGDMVLFAAMITPDEFKISNAKTGSERGRTVIRFDVARNGK